MPSQTTKTKTWRVPYAQHVVLEYEPRDPSEPCTQERRWVVRCEVCGDDFQGVCNTGRIREKANKFAVLHFHQDPFRG